MLIALIDDGIEVNFFDGINIKKDLIVEKSGAIARRKASDKILTDHGTTCAGIISKYAPEAEFISLRIFGDEKLRASCEQLVAALTWCLNNKIPIIHMSVGTPRLCDYEKIQPIVAKMIEQNQVIIAAHSNNDMYSIPACIGGVLGVCADENMSGFVYKICDDSPYQIKASSHHELISKKNKSFVTKTANSYAAPVITAAVHNYLKTYPPCAVSVGQVFSELSIKNISLKKPDFLLSANIFNPHRIPIIYDHLLFECKNELHSWSDLEKYSLADADLVYFLDNHISPHDNIMILQQNKNLYRNLVYCGKLDFEINLSLQDKLVWCENQVELSEFGFLKGNHPIVKIKSSDKLKAVNLLCKLQRLFLKEDYECIGITDYPAAYLYSLEYCDGLKPENAVRYYCGLYDPDIILCCFSKDECLENHDDGLFLVIDECDSSVEDDVDTRNGESGVSVCCFDNVNEVYERIVGFFD